SNNMTRSSFYPLSLHDALPISLNSDVTGQKAAGEAQLAVDGDNLVVTLMTRGVPANTVHWQHFHGFKDGSAATCATMDDDANGRSEEHTSELQSRFDVVCRLLL